MTEEDEWTRGKSVIEIDWSIKGPELTEEYRAKIADVVMNVCDLAMTSMLDIRGDLPIDPGVSACTFTNDKDHFKQEKRMYGLSGFPLRAYRNWKFDRKWAKSRKS